MTTLRHLDHLNTARFITTSCFNRFPLFNRPTDRDLVSDELLKFFCDTRIPLMSFVIMPEHVHFLILPFLDQQVGPLVGKLKFQITKSILAHWQSESYEPPHAIVDLKGVRHIWMKRCYDVNCRNEQSIRSKIDYCHNNPVRRGLVASAEDWKWSSLHTSDDW